MKNEKKFKPQNTRNTRNFLKQKSSFSACSVVNCFDLAFHYPLSIFNFSLLLSVRRLSGIRTAVADDGDWGIAVSTARRLSGIRT